MLVGRYDVVERIVHDARNGISTLLAGPTGIGRSAVLGEIADRLQVCLVHGSDTVEGVPFVPFAPLLHRSGVDPADPRIVYQELPVWLAPQIVVVDDVDALDLSSSTLLMQAVRLGAVVVASATEPVGLLPSLATLSATWARTTLPLLDDDAIMQIAAHRLGGPVTPRTAAMLLSRSAGLPAVAVDLLVEAGEEAFTTANGVDVLRFRPSPRALTARGHRLDGLDRDAAEFLDAVVLTGGLPVGSLGAEGKVLIDRGLLRRDGADAVPASELVVDLVLPRLTSDRWPHLVDVAIAACGDEVDPGLHRRLTTLVSPATDQAPDQAPEQALEETAEWLLTLDRSEHCLQLLRTARTAPLLLLRARAAALNDEPAAARADLDEAVATTTDEKLLVGAAHVWMMLLRDRLEDQDELRDRVAALADRLTDPDAKSNLMALLERRRTLVGEVRSGNESGHQQYDASTRALTAVMGGELHTAQRIMTESRSGPDQIASTVSEFDRTMSVLAEFLPIVYDGQMTLAREISEREYHRARGDGGDAAGLWGYNRAKISLHSGQYHHTAELATTAGQHLAWRDGTGLAMPCLALKVAGLARVGRLREAETLTRTFTERERQLPRVAIGAARVGAERLRFAGDAAAAGTLLSQAGRQAIRDGEIYSGVLALDEAFMLHPRRDVAADLAHHADRSHLLQLCAERAEAVLAADLGRVVAAAESLEALPMPGRAAHLWRFAADLQLRAGREAASRESARRSETLRSAWALPSWPEVVKDTIHRLTTREWQVARLAARRTTSREIAVQLGLSPRTVDNHLAACFRKLGVRGRDELSEALGDSVAPVDLPEDMLDL